MMMQKVTVSERRTAPKQQVIMQGLNCTLVLPFFIYDGSFISLDFGIRNSKD
jgi:hypothetical protein